MQRHRPYKWLCQSRPAHLQKYTQLKQTRLLTVIYSCLLIAFRQIAKIPWLFRKTKCRKARSFQRGLHLFFCVRNEAQCRGGKPGVCTEMQQGKAVGRPYELHAECYLKTMEAPCTHEDLFAREIKPLPEGQWMSVGCKWPLVTSGQSFR